MSTLELAREEIRNRGGVYLGDIFDESPQFTWVNRRFRHDQLALQDDTSRPAILYAIVYISKDAYRMTPCSEWDPSFEGGYGVKFKETKASAVAQDPGVPELQGDFANVCDLVCDAVEVKLQEDGIGKGQTNPLRCAPDGRWTGLKIQHRLFRSRWDRYNHWPEHPDPQFRIENWPANWPAEREELNKIVRSHVVVPLPAKDMDGNLIHPSQYEEKLKGAIVRVGFVLNHYYPLGGYHRFTADIHEIQVLQPPERDPKVEPSPVVEEEGATVDESPIKKHKSSPSVKSIIKEEEKD
ncbi:hypothetical protein NMY22_g6664 [Coprinellus aureogranulatus]|nr:hypothetical protein NMY22_g6664 [Coprinellus aureogranulatus]